MPAAIRQRPVDRLLLRCRLQHDPCTSAGADGDNAGVPEPTPYHYKVLLTRAQQLTAQSAQVEALYLSLLEKLDAATLKLQEAASAASIANLQLNVHADQVAAAIAGQAAAQAQTSGRWTRKSGSVASAGARIIQPPMLGVPALAWWLSGPSTRMIWPSFQALR